MLIPSPSFAQDVGDIPDSYPTPTPIPMTDQDFPLLPVDADGIEGDGLSSRELMAAIADAQAERIDLPTLPPIPETTHPSVDEFLAEYRLKVTHDRTQSALDRYGQWRERLAGHLRRANVPEDLLALAFVESLYNPRAVSKSDAWGFWQILPATARLHKLRRDAFVDARFDPDDATQFAAAYLRELYDQFGDWYLAMAAYNLGKGDLARLIESGAPKDFFALRDRGLLRKETADYVPKILAARRLLSDAAKYGYTLPKIATASTAGLTLRPLTDLMRLETLAGVPGGTVRDANPELRTGYAPADPGGYAVVVPAEYADALERVNLAETATAPWQDLRGVRRMEVKVKAKMTLYSLGRLYDTSLPSLRAWNGLTEGAELSRGQKLIVYVADDYPEISKP
ncbi:MAG: transglycosylase SLT domain-containing protein [Deltaproteobacteria bacterium]|nr:transglycosylase SLT domain-containing protein [Deltaproteobacteria bacterium]MCB9489971.1 transglycosylase SLT domain-containing protein [Deltaproteobacteria bacterium]